MAEAVLRFCHHRWITALRIAQAVIAMGGAAKVERELERLVWDGKAELLFTRPASGSRTWAGAFQQDLVRFGKTTPLRTPEAPAPAYPAVAVVMMVKDEADIIGRNLAWLHRTGVRRFVVADNGSTDATAERVREFRDAHGDTEVVTIHDPLVRYLQAEKTSGFYRLALSIWPDLRWIAPVDADEFLVAERGLTILDTVPASIDAVVIPKVIHYRSRAAVRAGACSTEGMDYRSSLSHVPPKVIARVDPLIGFTQGNHQIQFLDARRPLYTGGLALGLYMREFPNRSFEHFVRKVSNAGPAIMAARDHTGVEAGGWHWTVYHDILSKSGEEGLLETYRQQYVREVTDGLTLDPFPGSRAGTVEAGPLSRPA